MFLYYLDIRSWGKNPRKSYCSVLHQASKFLLKLWNSFKSNLNLCQWWQAVENIFRQMVSVEAGVHVIVKTIALHVRFECTMFLKSSSFSCCVYFPVIGSGDGFWDWCHVLCKAARRTANESLPRTVLAAEMEAMQLQLCGAALIWLSSLLHCARWMLQLSWH